MIIGISGLIGSGKDTIADYLVTFHGFRRESWAGTLKDAVSSVFGWDRLLLEGRTQESRQWREQRDEWWSERLKQPVTPRLILQLWGTEVCRQGYHDEIWIASLENKIRKSKDNIVITDCRFPNELDSIKRLGGITLRVERGEVPEWVTLAKTDFKEFRKRYPQIHASEFSSVDLNYDHTIDNNSSIDELYKKINDLLQYHQFSK